MKRWLLRLAGALAIAALTFVGTLIWLGEDIFRPRPDSSLTAGLPVKWDAARREFNHRVVARFPVGSSATAMAHELEAQGFTPVDWGSLAPANAAMRVEASLPCRIVAQVNWRTDEAGRLAAIEGEYGERGCL